MQSSTGADAAQTYVLAKPRQTRLREILPTTAKLKSDVFKETDQDMRDVDEHQLAMDGELEESDFEMPELDEGLSDGKTNSYGCIDHLSTLQSGAVPVTSGCCSKCCSRSC